MFQLKDIHILSEAMKVFDRQGLESTECRDLIIQIIDREAAGLEIPTHVAYALAANYFDEIGKHSESADCWSAAVEDVELEADLIFKRIRRDQD